jgi:hypothetical protein
MPVPSDFGSIVRRLFAVVRAVSLLVIGVSALVLGRETYALGRAAFEVHPALGWLYAAAVGFAAWRFVVVPAMRYWAMPAAVEPPAEAGDSPAAVRARAKFTVRVLENLARNPRAAAQGNLVAAVGADARLLAARAAAPGADGPALRAELAAFEETRVEPLFAALDEEANRVIRAEALAVGVGTAVSMNGVLDAWIVLWRNLNLVARLAEIYYGRPGLRGTLFVLRDVATGVFVASKAQGVAEASAGLFGGWLGKTGGALMGPVMDGALNAVIAVRIGYVAKRRCRAFRRWNEETALEAVQHGLAEAAAQAKGAALDVVKATGGALAHVAADAASAAGDAMRKAGDVVLSWFGKEEPATHRA